MAKQSVDAFYILTTGRGDRLSNLNKLGMNVRQHLSCACYAVASFPDQLGDLPEVETLIFPLGHSKFVPCGFPKPPLGWDVGWKRDQIINHALSSGYRWITMCDDDIMFSVDCINEHLHLIDHNSLVASKVDHFPDNSVVFHAIREINNTRISRPTGSLMTIDVKRMNWRFLNVYNEDLFVIFCQKDKGVGIANTSIHQMAHDPFREPAVAAWQEFYDLIAEGLLSSVGAAGKGFFAPDYWRCEISNRRSLLDQLINGSRREDITRCIASSKRVLDTIQPALCSSFVSYLLRQSR